MAADDCGGAEGTETDQLRGIVGLGTGNDALIFMFEIG